MDNQMQIAFLQDLIEVLDKHKVTLSNEECEHQTTLSFHIGDGYDPFAYSTDNLISHKHEIDSDEIFKVIQSMTK